jgi:hypothetical protein
VTLDINEARSALAKYLHYYQRWDNHCRSIRLEKKFQKKLEAIAKKEVEGKRGSWIDWEHLKKAGKLLAECRYTLKYTYPRAYFMVNISHFLVSKFFDFFPIFYVFLIGK